LQLGSSGFNKIVLIRYLDGFINGIDDSKKTSKNITEIYPNPASNKITLRNANLQNGSMASITDLTGKVLYQNSIDKTGEIDVSYLPRGIYILKLVNLKDESFVKKIVLTDGN